MIEKQRQFARKIDSRQSRAMQFLDKLEMAALGLKNKISPSSFKGRTGNGSFDFGPAITESLGKKQGTNQTIN